MIHTVLKTAVHTCRSWNRKVQDLSQIIQKRVATSIAFRAAFMSAAITIWWWLGLGSIPKATIPTIPGDIHLSIYMYFGSG
jgi:hypothetical protein